MTWIKDIWNKITSVPQDKLLHINICGLVTMITILLCVWFGMDKYFACFTGWFVAFIFGIGKEVFDEKQGSFFDGEDLNADIVGNTTITLYTIILLLLL